MKAIVFKGRRSPLLYEDFQLTEEYTKDRIRTRVLGASINRRDYWITKGLYPGVNRVEKTIIGSDAVVEFENDRYLVCPNIDWGNNNFPSPEYKILGLENFGTFSDYFYTEPSKLFEVPSHLSVPEASCLPLAGLTAYRTLFTRCNVNKRDKVLISGIGGGVATFAFLFSLALGCDTYVTSSSQDKINHAIELGAIKGALYTNKDDMNSLAESCGGFDVVIDSAGGEGFETLLRMCKLGARVGIYGGTQGSIKRISTPNLFFKQISILGSTMGSDVEFELMLKFVEEKKIKPIISSVDNMIDGPRIIEQTNSSVFFGKRILLNANK